MKSNKPLIKDMVSYFMNDDNWHKVWSSDEAQLRIDMLNHTGITRLVQVDVEDPYIGFHNRVITYSLEMCGAFDPFLGRYINSRPNHEEIKAAIKHQWRDNDAY